MKKKIVLLSSIKCFKNKSLVIINKRVNSVKNAFLVKINNNLCFLNMIKMVIKNDTIVIILFLK